MYINGKWYTETEAVAYVRELQAENKRLHHECTEWRGVMSLAQQEVHRPFPEYKYRFEIEAEKICVGGAENA